MSLPFPRSASELEAWARDQRVPISEARVRFAQFAVLHAICGSRELQRLLVFKGGNALDFVWLPNRSTVDLDFSIDSGAGSAVADPQGVRPLLQRSLGVTGRILGIVLNVQSLQPTSPRPEMTLLTYALKVGYAFPEEVRLARLVAAGQPVSRQVQIDISVNEIICATQEIALAADRHLRVSTLEDIVAEKLRSLLQQEVRNRFRPQDVLDIAVCLRSPAIEQIDPTNVARFLQRKARARSIEPTSARFRDPALWQRAHEGYGALQLTARETFIDFESARAAILHFVDQLPLPE